MNAFIFHSRKTFNTILKADKRILSNIVFNSSRIFCSKSDIVYDPIYHFPYIKILSPVCGLTKYGIVGTLFTTSVVVGLEYLSFMPVGLSSAVITAGAGITLTTLLSGQLFKDTIGYIYISSDDKTIKVSYINRFGFRIDQEMPVEDWVPLSELKDRKLNSIYFKTEQRSNSKKLKLFYNHGVKMIPEICNDIIENSKPVEKK